ncbi:50S ribosomal protein L19e [Candidatus Woesearchaeota archaeon]|nr:50S ribosomal protein L19e [Candidatus Woesearchaeota archaeon]
MELLVQKRLAASVLKCSPKRVVFNPEMLAEIKEGITKGDIRSLIKQGAIKETQIAGVSRGRAKSRKEQKMKGRQRGQGSRKGSKNARGNQKRQWINRVRVQRDFLKEVHGKDIVTTENYHMLYRKSKGGFFRSLRHLKLYMTENKLFTK